VRVAVGADHAGFGLKEHLRAELARQGHEVIDFGTDSETSTDYPDFAHQVAGAVARGDADRGLLVCGTGIGMAMAANRIRGVRAAAVTDVVAAEMARRHNDANVLAIGARLVAAPIAERLLDTFLATPFDGGRHQRRVDKLDGQG
jgi:ribose 5-phosphate isomerase B